MIRVTSAIPQASSESLYQYTLSHAHSTELTRIRRVCGSDYSCVEAHAEPCWLTTASRDPRKKKKKLQTKKINAALGFRKGLFIRSSVPDMGFLRLLSSVTTTSSSSSDIGWEIKNPQHHHRPKSIAARSLARVNQTVRKEDQGGSGFAILCAFARKKKKQ